MRAAGIDIGTTTISGVVLDTEAKKVLKAKTIQNGSFIKAEHEWEQIQDVSVIRTKACALLDELLEEFPDVEGIGLTGQMHGSCIWTTRGSASAHYIPGRMEEVRSRNLTVRALFRKYTKKQDLPCPQALAW